jgi:hypothetical protein
MTKKNQERDDSDADDHAAGGGVLADEVFTEAVCHHDGEPQRRDEDSRPASMAMSFGDDETSVAPMSSRSSLGLNPATHIFLSSKIHGRGDPVLTRPCVPPPTSVLGSRSEPVD